MLKTRRDIAKLAGVSDAAVFNFIKRRGAESAGKRQGRDVYDISAEPLAGYIAAATGHRAAPAPPVETAPTAVKEKRETEKEPPEKAAPAEAEPVEAEPPVTEPERGARKETKKPRAGKRATPTPLNSLFSKLVKDDEQTVSGAFYAEAYAGMKLVKDWAGIAKLGTIAAREVELQAAAEARLKIEQAKEKQETEKAEKLRINNAVARGIYIEREAVKRVFGRFYSAHTGRLQPLGMKLADTIAAKFGIEGAKEKIEVRELVDGEIYSALESIRETMEGWVKTA
jgi:hypothetical protein